VDQGSGALLERGEVQSLMPPASNAKVTGLLNFAADALNLFIDLPSCRDEEYAGRHVNWASHREA
jgi:hypothetical protein